jgi:hypothetical protein
MIGTDNPHVIADPAVILRLWKRTGFSQNTHFQPAFLISRAHRANRTDGREARDLETQDPLETQGPRRASD